ncbi:serine protease [Paucibacter sp. O1-1]|nr:serine protease [Paucibacter sp. O1-1]MDA3829210.1 serine protease [Paucibacter sp. O1-1]
MTLAITLPCRAQNTIDIGMLSKSVIKAECDLTTYIRANDCLGRLLPTLQYRAAHYAATRATYLLRVNYEPTVPGTPSISTGSAFLIDRERGYFITAKHVLVGNRVWSTHLANHAFPDLESAIEDHLARNVGITLHASEDATPVTARLIGMDRDSDLAMLAVSDLNLLPLANYDALFRPIPLARAGQPCVDPRIVVLGFQADALGRMLPRPPDDWASASCSLQPNTYRIGELKFRIPLHSTTLALNPGNSGGPVLDQNFEVVGVVSGASTGSLPAQYFFVPVSAVRTFLDRFR